MHRTERMGPDGIFRKMVILVLLTPFLLVMLNYSGAAQAQSFGSFAISLNDAVLVAGEYRYLNVTVLNETEKITIIAFSGATPPTQQDRSIENFYQWEYDDGIWDDASGYATTSIDLSRCHRENGTISFCIQISQCANPGRWTIVVLVDAKEVSSISFTLIVGDLCFFFSTIIGVFEPPLRQKYVFQENNVKTFEREKQLSLDKNSIDKIVDAALKEKASSSEDEAIDNHTERSSGYWTSVVQQDSLRPTISLYPRSKLKDQGLDSRRSLFRGEVWGGENVFSLRKNNAGKRLVTLIVLCLMLFTSVLPMIGKVGRNEELGDITILNPQSYPLVGGEWTVLFNTVGCADLTITAINGTTWSNHDRDHDLEFIGCLRGNETLAYTWVNNSVYIPGFSSNETCTELSQVLQPGYHTLMFQFGTAIAFAHNLASEHWFQTSTSDFNNGTKTNVNVSSGSFHLQERFLLRNFTRINNEGFESSWPPTGWAEVPTTSDWFKCSYRVYEGSYAAGFNGSGGHGGASGELQSGSMNCSGANVTAIYVKFWAYSYRGSADSYYLDYYNGVTWNQITRLDNVGVSSWTQYTQKITDRQYFVSNFQIRWRVIGLQNNRNYYVDVVNVTVERNESGYYATGNLVSQAHDTMRNMPIYNNMIVNRTTPSGTTVTPWERTADSQANLSSATWYSDITLAPKKRWVQWRINLTGNTYVTPTVIDVNVTWIYDNEKPVSAVITLSPYWKTSTPFQIVASASDNGTGVKEAALYYNYSATNTSGWLGWTLGGVNNTTNPYSWSFTAPRGDGFYRFYSRAVDGELNVEDPPSSPGFDTMCGIDTTKPSSRVDAILKYWHNATNNPLIITATNTSDATSGINNITLYYEYRKDNSSSWSAWAAFGVDQTAPWSWNFTFPREEGHYRFYSIAYDKVGNREDAPLSPEYDAQGGYDVSKPSSQVTPIATYFITFNPLPMSANASDDVNTVTLYYYYAARNSTWWNPNWLYRKQLTINGKNGGFQMKIVIGNTTGGNVNCNSHACSTFGDIRFISYSDNSTQLSYWLKNYTNGVQATFWVNNSQNDSSIWMYYGNRNAVTTSSGDATFYFFDDFSNGLNKWLMDSWNTDSIVVNQSQGNPSPSLKHVPDNSIPANRTYQDTRIRTATYKMRNGTIEYDVYLAGTPRVIHQFGWRVNALSWTNGYSWRLQNSNGDGGFYRFTGPTSWTQLGSSFPNAVVNTWYHVQVNVSGSNYAAIVNPACGGATTQSVSDSTKLTADFLVSHVHGVSMDVTNYVLVDNIFVRKCRASPPTWNSFSSEEQGYVKWVNASNPDTSLPWTWNFNFPRGYGYYWFYSLAIDYDGNTEDPPNTADARCYYLAGVAPVINSYDLRNSSGSKLDNTTGLLDVNKEYYFTVNVTAKYGWIYVDYIDIKAWYDQGSELTAYNQTLGGNLNIYLRYENITGTANFTLLWPKTEVQLVTSNCSQTVINSTTRIIKISFKPLSQVRWACSNNTWDSTKNTSNDPFSWNFNITVIDTDGLKAEKKDEYGVYRFTTLLPDKNWVSIHAPPGYNATTNVVNVTYSSNYDYNISVFFIENLTNSSSGSTIPIANNVYLLARADLSDDVTTDIMFTGRGEGYAVNIITTSGLFHKNNSSAVVHVQFNVYIPFGTLEGIYTAHVGTKIKQKR